MAKKQENDQKFNREVEEVSSQLSQETELDVSLPGKKGKKKTVQAKLDTSPPKNGSSVEEEDAMIQVDDLPALEASGSNKCGTPTSDILAGLSPMLEDDEEQDGIALYLRKMGELTVLLYHWQDAKEYPDLNPIDACFRGDCGSVH